MKPSQLEELVQNNIISIEQSQQITTYLESTQKSTFQTTLYAIGGLLIGLGLLSFVGLNWDYIPDLMKVVLMSGATGLLYRLGYYMVYVLEYPKV